MLGWDLYSGREVYVPPEERTGPVSIDQILEEGVALTPGQIRARNMQYESQKRPSKNSDWTFYWGSPGSHRFLRRTT